MARAKRRRRPPRRRRVSKKKPPLGKVTRLPISPPPLDIQSNVYNCWLRSMVGIDTSSQETKSSWSQQFNIDTLLTPEYNRLRNIFAEYRLTRVNVWFIPSVAITNTGIHALAVCDDGENYFVSPVLVDVCSAPGSCTGRAYQPLRNSWRITEPKDRNWILANTDTSPLSVYICATSGNTLKGVLIFDSHVTFRGLKSPSSLLRRRDNSHLSPSTSFSSLSMS